MRNKYLVIYGEKKNDKSTHFEWATNHKSKQSVKETYKSNGLVVRAVFSENDIEKNISDSDSKHYFFLQDLKGNGII